jgi:serine phosphatase RsbU (regulator of sigma subunit)/pSer/pThr/pTyr-binding forkhead associated (FHA) protein
MSDVTLVQDAVAAGDRKAAADLQPLVPPLDVRPPSIFHTGMNAWDYIRVPCPVILRRTAEEFRGDKRSAFMASLHVDLGPLQGQVVSLDREKSILGRNHDCHVIIPNSAVSRWHAQILRVGERYYVEDLKSRNGTAINDDEIAARTPLSHGARIRICDFQATFCDDDEEPDNSTVVEATLGSGSDLRLETQPAARLAALLAITAKLSKTMQLDALLPEIADNLLQLFRQADRCFLILAEEGTGNLVPKVVRTRRTQESIPILFSHTLVRQCLNSGQAILLEDAGGASGTTSSSVLASQIRSVMCVPLTSAEENSFGVIQLDTIDRSKKFEEDDLRLLWGVAQQAAVSLENSRLHEAHLAQERVRRDLDLARQMQRSFLPRETPALPGYQFYAYYEAAQAIGGDYYDFIPLPDGRLAIAVGDVAGKGIPAALLMAKLSSEARTCLLTERDPAVASARLNDALCPHTSSMDRFVTLILAVLDPATHSVTLVSAGHPVPLLRRPGEARMRDTMPLELVGPFLGLDPGARYDSCRLELASGDSLVLFTDGIPDAQSLAGAPFRMHGIHAAVANASETTPRYLGERIISQVRQHAAGVPQYDDMTLLCMGRL